MNYVPNKAWANILYNASPDERFVPFQLADDPDTYGDKAGWWIVVSPDFEEEHSGPVATREAAMEIIKELEIARSERRGDPYPEREFPTADND